MVPQGSQSYALGLAKTAASQVDEFVCSLAPSLFGQSNRVSELSTQTDDK